MLKSLKQVRFISPAIELALFTLFEIFSLNFFDGIILAIEIVEPFCAKTAQQYQYRKDPLGILFQTNSPFTSHEFMVSTMKNVEEHCEASHVMFSLLVVTKPFGVRSYVPMKQTSLRLNPLIQSTPSLIYCGGEKVVRSFTSAMIRKRVSFFLF